MQPTRFSVPSCKGPCRVAGARHAVAVGSEGRRRERGVGIQEEAEGAVAVGTECRRAMSVGAVSCVSVFSAASRLWKGVRKHVSAFVLLYYQSKYKLSTWEWRFRALAAPAPAVGGGGEWRQV